jgi:hypothetical protein
MGVCTGRFARWHSLPARRRRSRTAAISRSQVVAHERVWLLTHRSRNLLAHELACDGDGGLGVVALGAQDALSDEFVDEELEVLLVVLAAALRALGVTVGASPRFRCEDLGFMIFRGAGVCVRVRGRPAV